MECPHCFIDFDANKNEDQRDRIHISDGDTEVLVFHFNCPECKRSSIYYCIVDGEEDSGSEFPIYPRPDTRKPCPPLTPNHISQDYYEACLLIQDHPTAAAILSRRCLENILLDTTKTKTKTLALALEELKNRNELPSNLQAQIEAIKSIGNLAAHGVSVTELVEPVPITYKEVDWSLKILSDLLDYYYAQPEKIAKRKEVLNKKLVQAGQRPLK